MVRACFKNKINFKPFIKRLIAFKQNWQTGEMAQWQTKNKKQNKNTDCLVDLGSIPSIHVQAHNQFQGIQCPPLASVGLRRVRGAHAYMNAKHLYSFFK